MAAVSVRTSRGSPLHTLEVGSAAAARVCDGPMTSRRPIAAAPSPRPPSLAPAASAQAPQPTHRLRPAVLHGRAGARLHRHGLHARPAPSDLLLSVPEGAARRLHRAPPTRPAAIGGLLGVEEGHAARERREPPRR